ncbi:hypothetical protein JCM18882A_23500 [Brevibacterium metallidurans]|uniref:Uncharacterized protein n=2 Tax=Brevibacterium TaxID=1696 RepID=A0ABP9U9W2_9MICO
MSVAGCVVVAGWGGVDFRDFEPNAMVGSTRGWLPETIDAWEADLLEQGARTDLTKHRESEAQRYN